MGLSVSLDTNICIALLKEKKGARVRSLLALDNDAVAICSVVRAELVYGAQNSVRVAENLAKVETFLSAFESLPFDDAAANWYGSIRAILRAQGTPIGPNDLLIAAIAVSRGLTLITRNVGEFGRVPGLRVEVW